MKILFISNFFSHLQKPVSEEFYDKTGGNYKFIETAQLTEERKALGFDSTKPAYVIQYSESSKEIIQGEILEADIVIIGAAPLSLIKERLKKNKLTFRYSERYFKTRSRYLKYPIWVIDSFKTRKCYYLCSGAYASKDIQLTGFFKNKCYKWGYFPEVRVYKDIDELIGQKTSYTENGKISIVWAARLIRLKHPEYLIKLAQMLKKDGFVFEIHILGNGELENELKTSIKDNGIEDFVFMHGAMPPYKVREFMEKGDIFLLTSDRNEGWGAVLNEAMNSACAVVASHETGSAPFLINDGDNGLIFRSKDINSLYMKTKSLMVDENYRRKLGSEAYKTMTEVWSAANVVSNFITLAKSINAGEKSPIIFGPCSPAESLPQNWR